MNVRGKRSSSSRESGDVSSAKEPKKARPTTFDDASTASPPHQAERAKVAHQEKLEAVTIKVSADDLFGLKIPSGLNSALKHTSAILRSDSFEALFFEEVTDCDRSSFYQALSEPYTIQMLREKDVVSAFACVRRICSPNTIFLHPFILINMLAREKDGSALVEQHEIFLTVKIVHEIVHLLHYKCSRSLREGTKVTPPKMIQDIFKIAEADGIKVVSRTVKYNDLGEIFEKRIFGGMVEGKSIDGNDDLFMDIHKIGLYSSSETMFGSFVDGPATIAAFEQGNYLLVKRGEFVAQSKPIFTRVPMHKESARASRPDADVFDDRGEDEAEERDLAGDTCV